MRLIFFYSRYQDSDLRFDKIGRNLLKLANASLPKSPVTCDEIIKAFEINVVIEMYGTTRHDNTNLAPTVFYKTTYKCNSFAYVVFASDNIIKGIKSKIPREQRNFLLDATFKICPYGIFKQVLIVYIEHRGEVR